VIKFLEAIRYGLKRTLHQPLFSFYKYYTRKERDFKYDGLIIRLLPGIFHPWFFGSTIIFLNWLRCKNLTSKEIMELGAGNGLISLVLARDGGEVTATDISPTAVQALRENARRNCIDLKIIHSDLFEKVHDRGFDYVLINPPYFPRDPSTEAEHAFYCGADFDYFNRLFSQLVTRAPTEMVWIILSENCDLDRIHAIAKGKELSLLPVHKERRLFEWFYIFEVRR